MKKNILSIVIFMMLSAFVFADELYKSNVEASFYGDQFHGKLTASGETFNMYEFTAAHKTLPFNTFLRVTNLANGKAVVVRVNDRGPFAKDKNGVMREIDVSKAAAIELGMIQTGVAQVSLELVSAPAKEQDRVPVTETETPYTAPAEPKAAAGDPAMRWDIQLGAFSNKDNAETMAHNLYNAGFTNIAYQYVGDVTRVVLRDLSNEEIAEATKKLQENGFSQYLIRHRTIAPDGTSTPSNQ